MKYTKDDLAKMSDFEINKALAESLGGYGGAVGDWLPDGVKIKEDAFFYTEFHFNNWSDIMPLAVEHGVYYYNGTAFQSIDDYIGGAIIFDEPCVFDTKKPQRAIACCLILVLQERE